MSALNIALNIEQLEIAYGDKAILRALNLQVEAGDILCLLGPSGCGKTTLLKAIAGLVPLVQGKISIAQQVVNDGSDVVLPEHRNVGMIFQDYALFPHLTVSENIAFGLKGLAKAEITKRVAEMIALVKLPGLESRYPHQISGGQQQRVAIARSLAREPKLLLLDEPFSNIDSQVRHQLISEIRSIIKSHGVTAIFVTHSRDEAFAFGDKVALFEGQNIVQQGCPQVLYHQPVSPFVAEFMGKANYLEAKVVAGDAVDTVLGRIQSNSVIDNELGTVMQLMLRPCYIKVITGSEKQGVSAKVSRCEFMGDSATSELEVAGLSVTILGNHQLNSMQELEVETHDLVLF